MLKTKKDLKKFIENDRFMMEALLAAKSIGLSNWFIGAGFIRDTVWNIQHGYDVDHKFKDLDFGYYDPNCQSEEFDEKISKKLKKIFNVNWEVVNQAYVHKYNNVEPYQSAVDGLAHWVETATSVGVTLDKNNRVVIIDPWGVEDLLKLKLRMVPCHKGNEYYEKIFYQRINQKKWLKKWPKLVVKD